MVSLSDLRTQLQALVLTQRRAANSVGGMPKVALGGDPIAARQSLETAEGLIGAPVARDWRQTVREAQVRADA